MSGWQAYIDQLTAQGIALAAVVSLKDGALWACTPNLNSITKDETDKLKRQLDAGADETPYSSYFLAGTKYMKVSWDGFNLKMKMLGGEKKYLITVFKCNTCYIIAGAEGANERGALLPAENIVKYLREMEY